MPFVSFSLEPAYDTPVVLKQYAKDHGIDESNWRLLTGDAKAIYAFAKGFQMGAIPASGNQGIEHDTHFVLVDRNGKVCSYLGGADDEGWKNAAAEAVKISNE